jgi:pyruvate formate lyase activating enzyme
MEKELVGIVANIQKCSVHDGPGIRTTVFLKGCNLRCVWCHNPETLSFEPETLFYPERCISCGCCEEGCFSGARVLCGEKFTPKQAFDIVLEDRSYYGTDGGVTISGGEPTCQPLFTYALLCMCEEAGIHTAIETNLLADTAILQQILPHCRLVMADYKLFDPKRHKQYTGAGNENLLEHLHFLDQLGVPFIVRTPLVSGINDKEDVSQIARSIGSLANLLYYELLPYHPLGLSKGVMQDQARFSPPSMQRMQELAQEALCFVPEVRIAGKKTGKCEGGSTL